MARTVCTDNYNQFNYKFEKIVYLEELAPVNIFLSLQKLNLETALFIGLILRYFL